jgi:hypothetical protein
MIELNSFAHRATQSSNIDLAIIIDSSESAKRVVRERTPNEIP